MEHTIEIRNLNKYYGKRQVLKDVSFEVKSGRITAFLGPNGAGKSTTLRILLGLDRADSGEALIDNRRYTELRFPLRKIGSAFDGMGAPSDRSVRQHLNIIATSNAIDRKRIDEVLKLTGITHKANSKTGRLSLGEGQRMGIASALLGDPDILIFDEPINGLDPSGIRWFRKFIKEQAAMGKAILLSSHILSEVEEVADDLVMIRQGEIVSKGELKTVLKDLSSLEELFFELNEEE